jgi:hypothetical protein
MNKKSLQALQIIALVIGCLMVGSLVFDKITFIETFYQGKSNPMGYAAAIVTEKDLPMLFIEFFLNFGHALLAFLIAAVIRMIVKQAPVGKETASRLMIVCCLSYTGTTGIYLYYQILATIKFGYYWHSLFMPAAYPVMFKTFLPVLFAATIFVLYNHFTKMVTFESEVA